MSRFNPPFRSVLSYSVQNEDYATELAVLRQCYCGTPQLSAAHRCSGENLLPSLLTHESVAEVCAVDINPAQVQLCELRRTASEQLTRDEQLRLLGADGSGAGADWGCGAAGALSAPFALTCRPPRGCSGTHASTQELAFGVQHVGRNDVLMHDLQDRLQAAGFAPLRRPLTDPELPALAGCLCRTLMTPAYIREPVRAAE